MGRFAAQFAELDDRDDDGDEHECGDVDDPVRDLVQRRARERERATQSTCGEESDHGPSGRF
jgi:hypothetical protein